MAASAKASRLAATRRTITGKVGSVESIPFDTIQKHIRTASSTEASVVNYPEVGATSQALLPTGYRHLEMSRVIDAPLGELADILFTWKLHQKAGFRPEPSASRAEPGVDVLLHFVTLKAPCHVVWTAESSTVTGLAYGSRDGHPEQGEASFLLVAIDEKQTRFIVRSFSKPGRWFTKASGPFSRVIQRFLTARFLSVMQQLARRTSS